MCTISQLCYFRIDAAGMDEMAKTCEHVQLEALEKVQHEGRDASRQRQGRYFLGHPRIYVKIAKLPSSDMRRLTLAKDVINAKKQMIIASALYILCLLSSSQQEADEREARGRGWQRMLGWQWQRMAFGQGRVFFIKRYEYQLKSLLSRYNFYGSK